MMVATLVVIASPSPAPGEPAPGVVLGQADFSGHANGVILHADLLNAGPNGPRVVDAEVGFSGAAVDSDDFDAGVFNENGLAVVPAPGAPGALVNSDNKEAYGKGTGLEVGLGTNIPNSDENQLALGARAEAGATPAQRSSGAPTNVNETGRVIEDLLEVTQADPLLYVRALLGEAEARYSETNCMTTGNMGFGRGQAAKAQLIDTASNPNTPDLDAPLIELGSDAPTTTGVGDSQSFTYLVANSDGSFGVASETHVRFAPISLLRTDPLPLPPPPLVIEVLGEWILRSVATGKQGGSQVSLEIRGLDGNPLQDSDPILQINGMPVLNFQQLTLDDFDLDIPGLLNIHLDDNLRAIGTPPDADSDPVEASNGTLAAGALDVLRIRLADGALGDVRVGHLETRAAVPVDGINCPGSVRITKDAPDDAQDVTFDFDITCDDGTNTTRSITGDGTAQVDLIKSGSTCTVSEDTESGFEPQPSQQVGPIVTNGVHNVLFTNTRVPPEPAPPGRLLVEKDAPDDAQDVEFRFRIDCPGVTNTQFRREITGDGVDDVPVVVPGGTECTVHEFTEDGFVSQPDQTVTVPSDQTVIVKFVNERVAPGDGSLVVIKDAPDDAQDVNFTFRITCPGLSNDPFDRNVTGDGESEPVSGIPAGTVCTVHEDPSNGFVVQPDQQKTIVGDQENTVTFVNTRTPDDGGGDTLVGGEVEQDRPAVAGVSLVGGAPAGVAPTRVLGVQVSRAESAPAAAVAAQPRFTG
jgi:hypothetical protein